MKKKSEKVYLKSENYLQCKTAINLYTLKAGVRLKGNRKEIEKKRRIIVITFRDVILFSNFNDI